MDSPDDILKDIQKQGYELDFGKLQLLYIELLITNQVYLKSILKRQLELQEMAKGAVPSDIAKVVEYKMIEAVAKIEELANEEFYELAQKMIK